MQRNPQFWGLGAILAVSSVPEERSICPRAPSFCAGRKASLRGCRQGVHAQFRFPDWAGGKRGARRREASTKPGEQLPHDGACSAPGALCGAPSGQFDCTGTSAWAQGGGQVPPGGAQGPHTRRAGRKVGARDSNTKSPAAAHQGPGLAAEWAGVHSLGRNFGSAKFRAIRARGHPQKNLHFQKNIA